MANKIWIITGASSGFGYSFAKAAVKEGHTVVATARHIESLIALQKELGEQLQPMKLDVTNRNAVFELVKSVAEQYGRIDIMVSNAGFGFFGDVEETSDEHLRQVMETNFFGSVNVIQAVLPIMRLQGTGHILQTTSMGGQITFPFNSSYSASKWAMEAICETLSKELEGTDIHVTIIEPGAFNTGFSTHLKSEPCKDDFYASRWDSFLIQAGQMMTQQGNPDDAAKSVIRITGESKPPLRLALGAEAAKMMIQAAEERIKEWHKS